jgi:hypothetical protein
MSSARGEPGFTRTSHDAGPVRTDEGTTKDKAGNRREEERLKEIWTSP